MRAPDIELAKPYAGWAALALLVLGLFLGLFSSRVLPPILLLAGALALAAFRYRDELKTFDFWALEEWLRTRREGLRVRQWYAPHHAAEYFCNPAIVESRNEAANEMNTIMMGLIRKPDLQLRSGPIGARAGAERFAGDDPSHLRYDAAQSRHNQCNAALARELQDLLTRGDLLAKGLLMKGDVALAERLIPTSRWRVMTLDIAKGNASGAGWRYTGLLIGKRIVPPRPQRPKAPPPPTKAPANTARVNKP